MVKYVNARLKVILKRKINKCEKFITGFHGIGLVGSLTVDYLIRKLNAEKIGYAITKELPPYVSLSRGAISLPYEIYNYEDMVFFKCNVPMGLSEMRVVTLGLAKWVTKQGFKEALLIGGLDDRLKKNKEDKLRLAPTRKFLEKYHDKVRGELLEEGLYIVGPLALLLAFFEIEEFPALTILPYASIERVDPLAATVAIQYLNDIYKLSVDTSELEERGFEIERDILERRKHIEEFMKTASKLYYV